MKKPWFTFAGICSLVLGIVLFSIIFGGYSSLLRSQTRIKKVTALLVAQCRTHLELLEPLGEMNGVSGENRAALLAAEKSAATILSRMEQSGAPLPLELIAEFETAQTRLKLTVSTLIQGMASSASPLPPEFTDLETKIKESNKSVFIMGKRFNKEARYFNTRTRVFPGFIIARIFGLGDLAFPEIAVHLMDPFAEQEASDAS